MLSPVGDFELWEYMREEGVWVSVVGGSQVYDAVGVVYCCWCPIPVVLCSWCPGGQQRQIFIIQCCMYTATIYRVNIFHQTCKEMQIIKFGL